MTDTPHLIPVTARGADGYTDWALRHLDAPTRGIRIVEAGALSLAGRATAILTATAVATATVRNVVVTDLTAARLWGLPLPPTLANDTADISVSVNAGGVRPRRDGVRGRRLRLPPEHLQQLGSVRLTTPARTWVDCAAFLSGADVVATGDDILHRGLATSDDLRSLVHWAFRRRGVAKCRTALQMLDGRAESPGESRVRFELLTANVPRPQCNANVFDAYGGWLARGDMVWERERVILEYDGAVHLPENQRRRDAQRRNLLQDAGWLVLVVTAADLRTPWIMVGQVMRALHTRRPHPNAHSPR